MAFIVVGNLRPKLIHKYGPLRTRANKAHVSANFTGTDPIVSRIARAEGIDRFDRGKPADLFMRRRDQFLPALSEETLANFETIIVRVNQTLLPKQCPPIRMIVLDARYRQRPEELLC